MPKLLKLPRSHEHVFDQTKWHPHPPDAEIMDQHDHNEDDLLSISTPCEDPAIDQDQFYEPNPARIKKWHPIENIPDIELTPPPLDKMIQISPAIEDPYDSASLL